LLEKPPPVPLADRMLGSPIFVHEILLPAGLIFRAPPLPPRRRWAFPFSFSSFFWPAFTTPSSFSLPFHATVLPATRGVLPKEPRSPPLWILSLQVKPSFFGQPSPSPPLCDPTLRSCKRLAPPCKEVSPLSLLLTLHPVLLPKTDSSLFSEVTKTFLLSFTTGGTQVLVFSPGPEGRRSPQISERLPFPPV